MAPVLTAIEELINAKAIELILPQIVLDEFARNRDRVDRRPSAGLFAYSPAVHF
jgi:hypothetical protein